MAETLVKNLTGDGVISARRIYCDKSEFRPECKIFLAANHQLEIKGTDDGIWRRIRTIPFRVKFDKPDRNLLGNLLRDKEAVLAWIIGGCMEWRKDGLNPPRQVTEATAEYRDEMDLIQNFIDQTCEVEGTRNIEAPALYEAYQYFCDKNGTRPLSANKFGRELTSRGFERKPSDGKTYRVGIGLKFDPFDEGQADLGSG